jgi:hypothetical protein
MKAATLMQKTLYFVLAIVLSASITASAATPDAVDQSIARAVKWIYSQQKNGNWEEVPVAEKGGGQSPNAGQYTGRTALSVLALLYSGERSSDPRIKSAVDFLMKVPTEGVYALGNRCQVWLLLPNSPEVHQAMLRDARVLATSFKRVGNARGMYDYTPSAAATASKSYSHSRSQYAVLGMWAAEQSGIEVPDAYWKMIEDAWIRNQDKSGGWRYMNPADTKIPVTPGMTTVGVASLMITQEYLRSSEGIACRGNQTSKPIEAGIKWLAANMDKLGTNKPYERDFPYATLYAYERVGAASGLRYFGGVDWYEKGSDWALTKQAKDGHWSSGNGGSFSSLADTDFAVLFLSKGRSPIVMSKLQYSDASGKEMPWNQRSRDVANLVRQIGKTIERELAFQIVDLKAPLEDMLESPLLYMSGSDAFTLSDADKAKIKAYIEGGGIVLGNADCGSAGFASSFKKLGTELFPETEFAELPQDNIIYTDYYPRTKWRTKPSVLSLSNGARQLMILVPQADPAKAWQLQDSRSREDMFLLPADILLYAVDRQGLRYRGDRYYLPDNPALKATQTIDIARIQYPGYWDPEPGGWRRMNNVLKKREHVAIDTKTVELGKNALGGTKIATLTGTGEYKFTDAQAAELKKFVDGGGTLIVDAAGGNSPFATSVETLLSKMYPDHKLQMLPPDHPLYTAGGGEADAIRYRTFAIHNGVGRTTSPRLQGITIDGRLAVIYSREDLSVGLVGQAVDGIVGYTPETATDLMTRILNYTAKITPPAKTTKPAAKEGKPAKTAKPAKQGKPAEKKKS